MKPMSAHSMQQTATDVAGPVIVTALGVSNNPAFFEITSFTQLVATTASIVGVIWGLINIGKFVHYAYRQYVPKHPPKKDA